MTELCNIHVLHIVSGDLWAGAEVQLFTLAKTLHSRPAAKVSVVLLNPGALEQQLRDIGIEVNVLDESKLNGFQILRRLIHIIHDLEPDVIHTHRNKENILGSLAARLIGNIPTLRTAHGAPEHRPVWYHVPKRTILFLDWFCGRFLQKSIIAVSDDLAETLMQDYPSSKIHVIENGIDAASLTQIKPIKPNPDATQKTFRIGFAGRLVPVKRVDMIIRTARQLLDEYPKLNISFHIFGDGPLLTELKALNEQLQTRHIVHFEGHCENIPNELQRLDALLMTSDHEGLPMILLEAMALQTPIIAHAVGGIPNLLDQGSCGYLVEDHSASGYAREIYNLYQAPKLRTTITDNALKRVNEHYSAEQNAKAYCAEYNNLLKPAT